MVRAASAVAAVLGLATLAASAQAATVSVGEPPDEDLQAAIRYQAAEGEVNQATLTVAPSGAVTVEEATAPLAAGPGCTALDARTVRCAEVRSVDSAVVELGDLDDAVRVAVARRSRLVVEVNGGPGADLIDGARAAHRESVLGAAGVTAGGGDGDDRLVGSAAADELAGGPGADVLTAGAGRDTLAGDLVSAHDPFSPPPPPGDDLLDGGAGVDTATYADRRTPLAADLQRGLGGQRGERDRLAGIENLVGGRDRDVLRGDAEDNQLSASQFLSNPRAGDVLVGRDGDDRLEATSDRTRLDGGRGDDVLSSGYRRQDVRCGPGTDRLWHIAQGILVRRDCEWVELGVRYSPVTTRGGRAFIRIEIRRPISWCAGTIVLRSPRGRLSSRVRWETGRGRAFRRRLRISMPLTPAGRRAAAAHRVATIHARDRCTDARGRWRMPL